MGETGVQRNLREEMLPLLPHFLSVDENAVFQIAAELPAECSRVDSPVVRYQLLSINCKMMPVAIATRT